MYGIRIILNEDNYYHFRICRSYTNNRLGEWVKIYQDNGSVVYKYTEFKEMTIYTQNGEYIETIKGINAPRR